MPDEKPKESMAERLARGLRDGTIPYPTPLGDVKLGGLKLPPPMIDPLMPPGQAFVGDLRDAAAIASVKFGGHARVTDEMLHDSESCRYDHPFFIGLRAALGSSAATPQPVGVRTATRRLFARAAGRVSDVWYVIRHGLPDPDDA